MSIKTKEVRICDECGSEIIGYGIRTESVPNEGYSEIKSTYGTVDVGEQDFCNIKCLFSFLKKVLDQ